MARTQNPNLEIIEIAVQALGSLSDELVFLGGCATALLIKDSGAPPVRATRDVDTLAEIGAPSEYESLKSDCVNVASKWTHPRAPLFAVGSVMESC